MYILDNDDDDHAQRRHVQGRYAVRVIRFFAVATALTGSLLSCCAGRCDASPEGSEALTYYCFCTPMPKDGFCESRALGWGTTVAEPLNLVFCLISAAAALAVLLLSPSAPVIFHVLYALIVAWGTFAAMYHVGLENGMYRMMDAALSFLQAFIVLMLIRALCIYHAYAEVKGTTRSQVHGLFVVCAIIFTMYPAAVHVAGESTANPWIAWLVFDLLWIVILALLGLIWVRRRSWPGLDAEKSGFALVWKSVLFTIFAYAAWSIDKFVCSEKTPFLGYWVLHGWWHVFMSLSLISLTTLALYLTSVETGQLPMIKRFPARGPWSIFWVSLEGKNER